MANEHANIYIWQGHNAGWLPWVVSADFQELEMLLIITELNFLTPDFKDQPQYNHQAAYGSVAARSWWIMARGPECLHEGWEMSWRCPLGSSAARTSTTESTSASWHSQSCWLLGVLELWVLAGVFIFPFPLHLARGWYVVGTFLGGPGMEVTDTRPSFWGPITEARAAWKGSPLRLCCHIHMKEDKSNFPY